MNTIVQMKPIAPLLVVEFRRTFIEKISIDPIGSWFTRLKHRFGRWLLRDAVLAERIERTLPYATIKYNTDGRRLLEQIRLSRRDIEMLWRGEAKVLVVGHDFRRAIDQSMDDVHCRVGINLSMPFGLNGEIRCVGLRVEYVPWINGWAILPDFSNS